MKFILILLALMISSLFAGERKSLTLNKARALIAKADTVLMQQAPTQELGSYTMAVIDPVTGESFKVTKSPPTTATDDSKTSTAMLMK